MCRVCFIRAARRTGMKKLEGQKEIRPIATFSAMCPNYQYFRNVLQLVCTTYYDFYVFPPITIHPLKSINQSDVPKDFKNENCEKIQTFKFSDESLKYRV
jgi:hypothetical protein